MGKLGEKDFCFQESALSDNVVVPLVTKNCIPSVHQNTSCSQIDSDVQFGTVSIQLNFTLHKHFLNSSLRGIFSSFSGKYIKAQIKG